MKFRLTLALSALLACFAALPAQAGFTSIRVFGDSISSTTGNNTTYPNSTNYYEKRYSNGRVWVEVLAQQQGLPYIASNNVSFFGNYSYLLLQTVTNYTAPADAGTALYVVWVNNADLLEAAYNDGNNSTDWAADVNKSLTNHFKIITNLWGKGARTLLMPNAVDISTIPFFNGSSFTNYIRQQCIAYNAAFASMLNQAKAKCPGLTVITPDYYTLLNDILAHPVTYGVTNALGINGRSIDAVRDINLANKSLNGPGGNYIFWDFTDPSAKVHYIMANAAQQLISPVPAIPPQIAKLTVQPNGSNRLDMVNLPPGMNGLVEGRTNLLVGDWTTCGSFKAGEPVVFVPAPVPPTNQPGVTPKGFSLPEGRIPDVTLLQFYRLSFPQTNWMWP